jgi:hypothetical protein
MPIHQKSFEHQTRFFEPSTPVPRCIFSLSSSFLGVAVQQFWPLLDLGGAATTRADADAEPICPFPLPGVDFVDDKAITSGEDSETDIGEGGVSNEDSSEYESVKASSSMASVPLMAERVDNREYSS